MGGTHEIVFRVYQFTRFAHGKTPEKRRRWHETIYEVEIPEGATVKTLPAVDQRWRACELAHLPLRTW